MMALLRMSCIFVLILLNCLAWIVHGSHFLGGTITWRLLNQSTTGTPVAIVITQTYSWSYSLITCTNAMISSNQFIPSSSYPTLLTNKLNCIANCTSGAIGYVAPNIIPRCTNISPSLGITVGQRSDTVSIEAGSDFSVAYQDTAWRPLASSASAAWSVSSRIQLSIRPDNSLYNNAPTASLMSPINIPYNQLTAIYIPVADADGDITRCRWSTSSDGVDECGGVCPPGSLLANTMIYPNCTIIIIDQTVGDWFAITLMVEDFINSSSIDPLSSVPVQFLVQVVSPPGCTIPPEIIGIPLEQACIPLSVGQTFNSELMAVNNCGLSVTIVDIATLSFSGMIQGNIAQLNTTIYYKTLSWIPTTDQIGFQVMCAMALDSQNAQSAQYCFKFYVSETFACACPGETCITTTTT
ncbi:unnamed protein product [Adineta steineri]|uniref:Uncharacterized protein n=1 Tax=Adineta steineri TaxID=433720 RepID=A0A818ZKS3_9BILA|nr:unnamed protein product [Adineta steineri]